MTKSLLTKADVKEFIYSSLSIFLNEELTREGLTKRTSLTRSNIDTYKSKGMPYIVKGKKTLYKLTDVISWLNKNNIAFKLK